MNNISIANIVKKQLKKNKKERTKEEEKERYEKEKRDKEIQQLIDEHSRFLGKAEKNLQIIMEVSEEVKDNLNKYIDERMSCGGSFVSYFHLDLMIKRHGDKLHLWLPGMTAAPVFLGDLGESATAEYLRDDRIAVRKTVTTLSDPEKAINFLSKRRII